VLARRFSFGDRVITEKKRSGFEVFVQREKSVLARRFSFGDRVITEKKQSGFEVFARREKSVLARSGYI